MHLTLHEAARALGGEVSGRNTVRCPSPGKSRNSRSMAVSFNADGSFVCHSFADSDWRECRDHVKACLGISNDKPVAFNDNRASVNVAAFLDEQTRIDRAASLWAETVPLADTLAERYLTSRGLSYVGDEIRFHPGRRMMVAIITDAFTGEPCGVHRTFLNAEGNRIEKKMLGRAKGAVVRISADEDVTTSLAIAEGIETALAVPFRPVWACLSAGTMRNFPVLSGLEALTIFADNDASGTGLSAARECAERWSEAGCEVTIRMMDKVGADYADAMAEAA